MGEVKRILKSLFVLIMAVVLNLSMVGQAYATEAITPEATQAPEATQTPEAVKTVDLNGTYHAALGIQTCNTLWVGRYAYYDTGINDTFGTDKYSKLFSGAEKSNNYVEYAGTFQDVTIEGNGTYTVSLNSADFAGDISISQLYVATDIPQSDEITFSDVKVKINGKSRVSFDEAYMENETKFIAGGMVILAINHWRAPLEKYLTENGLPVNGNGIDLLTGLGDDNIEISFKVSGFAYDKVEPTITVAPTVAAADNQNTDAVTDTKDKENTGNLSTILIVIGVILVVVAGIGVVVAKKNKKK